MAAVDPDRLLEIVRGAHLAPAERVHDALHRYWAAHAPAILEVLEGWLAGRPPASLDYLFRDAGRSLLTAFPDGDLTDWPTLYSAWCCAAAAHRAGKPGYDGAAAYLRAAVAAAPDLVWPRLARGEYLAAQGRWPDVAQAIDPVRTCEVRYEAVARRLRRLVVLVDAYDRGATTTNDDALAVLSLADLAWLLESGLVADADAARSLVRSGLALSSRNSQDLARFAEACHGAGFEDASARAHERVLELDPEAAVSLRRLSQLRYRAGDPTAALDLAERGVRAAPEDLDAHAHLGNLARNVGAFDRAAAALSRAVRFAPDRRDLVRAQADALERSGARRQALAVAVRGLKRWPDDPDLIAIVRRGTA